MSIETNITIDGDSIRRELNEESKKWYFSVIDVVSIVTNSSDPRNYWKVLKSRLNKSNKELVTRCNQLKMPSSDGKSYLTDTADSETILEIVKIISDSYTTPLRLYFEKIEMSSPHIKKEFLEKLGDSEEIELPIDMYQTSSEIIIESLVAGSSENDVLISVNYKKITIKGKRVIPKNSEEYLMQEIYWGTFSRNIDLPSEVQIDKVEATINHGSLLIKLPKIDTNRNRIVKIKSI